MKKKLFGTIAIVVMLAACGNGQLSKNGLLGELPSVVMEKGNAEKEIKAKAAKADKDDATKLLDDAMAQALLFKEKMKQAGDALKDKEIPVEVAPNVFIKTVKPLTVIDANGSGELKLATEVEMLEHGSYFEGKGGVRLDKLGAVVADNDGKEFYAGKINASPAKSVTQNDCYPKGTTATLKFYLKVRPYNAASFANMKKVTITCTDRDEYSNAQNVDKEAEELMEKQTENK